MSCVPFFLFAHGWSLDAGVWDAVRSALPDARTAVIERGYMGAAPSSPTVPAGYIGVGHSAGVLDLLCNRPPRCAGMVAINGFARFSQAPGFPEGVPVRVLDRMLLRLPADATATVSAFRTRCGDAGGGCAGTPQADRLEQGLRALRDQDGRVEATLSVFRILALAGRHDPIVSPELTAASFRPEAIRWNETAGHLLPLTHPDWCARQLMGFARA